MFTFFSYVCRYVILSIYTYIYLAVIPHVSSWSLVHFIFGHLRPNFTTLFIVGPLFIIFLLYLATWAQFLRQIFDCWFHCIILTFYHPHATLFNFTFGHLFHNVTNISLVRFTMHFTFGHLRPFYQHYWIVGPISSPSYYFILFTFGLCCLILPTLFNCWDSTFGHRA